MYNIGVIILNYLAYQATMDTIASFKKQKTKGMNVKYVIVDNCSNNNSYLELKKKYKNCEDIIVVKADKNLGFANGNNLGYKTLLKFMNPDFVIISNDDILIENNSLFTWLIECFDKYHYAVLGPDIYSINGKFHQSPVIPNDTNVLKCYKQLIRYKMSKIKGQIRKLLNQPSPYVGYPSWDNRYYKEFHNDMALHGSFQIFSKLYFDVYSEPYDPSTFLYMEEDILFLRCKMSVGGGLKMVYDPSFQIKHLQAVSTNMINSTNYDKEIFRKTQLIKSMNIYIHVLKKMKKEASCKFK